MNSKCTISKLRIYFNLKNRGEHFNKIRVVVAIAERLMLRTAIANALDQKVHFVGFVPFGELNGRHVNIQTIGLTTRHTFKMDMIMVMAC